MTGKVLSVGLSIDRETFSQSDYVLFAERLEQSLVVLRDLLICYRWRNGDYLN